MESTKRQTLMTYVDAITGFERGQIAASGIGLQLRSVSTRGLEFSDTPQPLDF
jgi:hypothetical protein